MTILSQVFSTITSAIPLLKISKWDVQVQKVSAQKKEYDGFFAGIRKAIDDVKDIVHSVQDKIAGFFQGNDTSYTTIAEFDSFISFQGEHNSEIVRNAIENGSFRSVNKIKTPNMVTVELAKGGYRSGIEEVLERLKKYEGSTTLCRVVTPFGILENLNIVKLEYSYTRDNGANLLVAKLTMQEIIGGTVKEKGFLEKYVRMPTDTDTQNTGQKVLQSGDFLLPTIFGGDK